MTLASSSFQVFTSCFFLHSVAKNQPLLFISTNIYLDFQFLILPLLVSTAFFSSCQVLIIIPPIWTTAKPTRVSLPATHTLIPSDRPSFYSFARSVSTSSSFPAPTGSHASSTSDWLWDLISQTTISGFEGNVLVCPHILHLSYTSHTAKDFSINSKR